MPELPEVETIRRDLERVVAGKVLAGLQIKERVHLLKNCTPQKLKKSVTGRRLERIERRGKYLLFRFDPAIVLLHLRMSGRLLLEPAKHTRLVLQFPQGRSIYFDDARRFGSLYLTDTTGLQELPQIKRLGLEPFSPQYTLRNFRAKLNSKQEIKRWLLDQTKVAGVGNIYASEALFQSKISPMRMANDLDSQQIHSLFEAVSDVLQRAIDSGGTSIDSYRTPTGELGNFQNNFSVYERENLPCHRCGAAIRRLSQGGRSTYFCPNCQS